MPRTVLSERCGIQNKLLTVGFQGTFLSRPNLTNSSEELKRVVQGKENEEKAKIYGKGTKLKNTIVFNIINLTRVVSIELEHKGIKLSILSVVESLCRKKGSSMLATTHLIHQLFLTFYKHCVTYHGGYTKRPLTTF